MGWHSTSSRPGDSMQHPKYCPGEWQVKSNGQIGAAHNATFHAFTSP